MSAPPDQRGLPSGPHNSIDSADRRCAQCKRHPLRARHRLAALHLPMRFRRQYQTAQPRRFRITGVRSVQQSTPATAASKQLTAHPRPTDREPRAPTSFTRDAIGQKMSDKDADRAMGELKVPGNEDKDLRDHLEQLTTTTRFENVKTAEGHMILTGRGEASWRALRRRADPHTGAVQSFGCMVVVRISPDGQMVVRQAPRTRPRSSAFLLHTFSVPLLPRRPRRRPS